MLTTALTKIAFLIAGAIAAHITWTAPNPPPKHDERKKYGHWGAGDLEIMLSHWMCVALKVGPGFLALCETITILALQYPSTASAHLQRILSFGLAAPQYARLMNITPVFLVGSVLQISAGLLRVACYNRLGRYFTFPLAVAEDQKLITSGPYAFVRHPSYTAIIIQIIGMLLCQLGRGSWVVESGVTQTILGKAAVYTLITFSVMMILGVVVRTDKEDEVLKGEFGEEWEAWSRKTPSKLIPGIF